MNNSSQQIRQLFETTHLHTGEVSVAINICVKLVMILVIIITNSLVLVVVWRVPDLFRSIDILLVNLAVVDSLTGLSIVFQMCLDFFPQLLKNRLMCLFYFQMPTFFMLTSGYIILVVALERYMIMFHNITHQRLRKSKSCTVLSVASAYIVSGLIIIYPYLDKHDIVDIEVCIAVLIFDNIYLICLSVNIWAIVPVCSIIYVKIIYATRRQMNMIFPDTTENANFSRRTMNPNELQMRVLHITQSSSGQANPSFTKLKETRLRLAVTIGFAVCWLPVSFIPIFNLNHSESPLKHIYLTRSFLLLGMANSVVNPIIYMISRRTFRQALKTLYRCSS